VELAPPPFWLDPAAVVDMLAGWYSWTSRISPKAGCSEPLVMVVRMGGREVDGFGSRLGVELHLDGDVG
jgi:hypothetical protein